MAQQLDVRYVNFYCTGSSALKVDTVVPLKTSALPRKTKAKKIILHIDPIALAGIVMAAIMTILLAVGFTQLSQARTQELEMAAYVATLQEENEKLADTFLSECDLERVEEVALALGMVPKEQLQTITVSAAEPVQEEEPGRWQIFWAAIVDLFA
ncbi:MAG: hypothetical protein IKA47_13050 [Oscillospiraceae bacterium]|nr:hypothetical protein [Oscillospiraceae bacterium]